MLINTGDTIQGSAEALFTKGQALVDVLNRFGIDAYAPGNWDWIYGVDRALELFAGKEAKAPWHALAANAYHEREPYAAQSGSRLLPPYLIRDIDGVKVGILGITTDRGPQVVGRGVTKAGERAKRIMVADRATNGWKPLEPEADYTYASYYYARDPDLINTTPAKDVSVVKDKDGRDLDAVEVVTRYLARLPNRTTAPKAGRLHLVKPVPAGSFGSPEIQPWRGALHPTEKPPMTGANRE